MQNYRGNAMPYNTNCGNGYNGHYRYSSQAQVQTTEHRTSAADCCTPASDIKSSCKDDMVLAMAYVKWQKWQKIYDAEKALHHGTIFEELDLPFCGIGGCQK